MISSDDIPVFYCHGLPGGSAELDLTGTTLPVLDRRHATRLTDLLAQLPETPVHLVGFSLGTVCALRLAAQAPDRIARLTLISSAAPLELGDFLPDMAGRAVFRAARIVPLFHILVRLQSLFARIAPARLAAMLRDTCDSSDKTLLSSPERQAAFVATLRQGYGINRAAMLREIPAYVQPWAQGLADVRCPVTLYHGTADRWSPPAMAEALASALPRATLHRVENAGHYSTLVHVLGSRSA